METREESSPHFADSVVDRAPKGEKTSAQVTSTKLKVKRGKAAVRIRCTTSKRCTGKVSVKVKARGEARRAPSSSACSRDGPGTS